MRDMEQGMIVTCKLDYMIKVDEGLLR